MSRRKRIILASTIWVLLALLRLLSREDPNFRRLDKILASDEEDSRDTPVSPSRTTSMKYLASSHSAVKGSRETFGMA